MQPILYIVMRGDLHTMAGGKGFAQSAHATNMLVDDIQKYDDNHDMKILYNKWCEESGHGFGTTIVLTAPDSAPFSFEFLFEALEDEQEKNHLVCGIVHDPTYPIKDGKFTHLIPVDTCGYVFLDKENAPQHVLDIIGEYSLYPTFEVKDE